MKFNLQKNNSKEIVDNTSQTLLFAGAGEDRDGGPNAMLKISANRILCFLLIALCFIANSASAQQGRPGDRIHAIKVGYLTGKLNLTSRQATEFWPVYNQYENDKNAARRAFRKKYQKEKDIETMDNPGQYIDDNLDYQQQLLDLNKSYKDAFLRVISAQQLASLYEAERDFKKLLLQQLRNRRERN